MNRPQQYVLTSSDVDIFLGRWSESPETAPDVTLVECNSTRIAQTAKSVPVPAHRRLSYEPSLGMSTRSLEANSSGDLYDSGLMLRRCH